MRIEPTTSDVKATCSNHCATGSYSARMRWTFECKYMLLITWQKTNFWHWHVAIWDFWRPATALRLSGAMVRANAFHALAWGFNPRYCKSVRQCSSIITVLPDQVELHPSQFSLGQRCRQGCWGHTRVWSPGYELLCHIPLSWERISFINFSRGLVQISVVFTSWFFWKQKCFHKHQNRNCSPGAVLQIF